VKKNKRKKVITGPFIYLYCLFGVLFGQELNDPCLRKDPYSVKPLEGLKIADVGCGGGILSEVYIFSFSLFRKDVFPFYLLACD
jgi:2-polyprenyl-3-methyl-5-hydroxy-6-metoxy-1,4-benzoquinol methylase